jgi:hypothetical protein
MGKLTNIAAGLLFAAASAYGGFKYAQHEYTNADYQVLKTEQGNELYSKALDKSYEIREVAGELFVGNADHNFRGAKTLTIDETINIILADTTTSKQPDTTLKR